MKKRDRVERGEIGGRWAISLRTSLYSIPVFVLGIPIIETSTATSNDFNAWIIISTISLIPAALLLYIAHLTHFKNRAITPVPGRDVFILGFVVGAVRGLVLSLLTGTFDLHPSPTFNSVTIRTINSGLIAALAIPAISLFMSYRTRYFEEREHVLNELLSVESRKDESKALEESLREASVVEMETRINEILRRARSDFEDATRLPLETQWAQLSTILREVALRTVRPLSHSLNQVNHLRASKSEIARYVFNNIQLEIPWVLLAFFVTSFKNLVVQVGLLTGVSLLSIRIALLALLLSAANSLQSATKSLRPYAYIFYGGLAIALYSTIERVINRFFNVDINYSQIVIEGFWIAILIVFFGCLGAFMDGRRLEIKHLESLLQSKKIEGLRAERRNQETAKTIAKYLHGTVQSRLMASAIAIENAGRKGDKEELDKQIDFAYEHLKFDSIRIVSVQLENLSAVKKEVEEKWGSLLELSMNYPTDISLHHQELQDIYQALGEALANSFRHGEATSAWILIEKSKDGIRVHVTDNGKGVGNFKPGLGSEYFNVIAGNSWSLKNADNQQGATLSLFLKGVGVSGDK